MSTKTAAASKPRTTRKPPPVASAPDLVPETSVQLVPIGLLGRAPENVRHTASSEDVDKLADDIAAHGLLQSLIGYQDDSQTIFPEGYTWIVGGGRRLQALTILLERGLVGDAYRVPVLIRPQEEAIELSLSENLARRDMNPADEFTAFAQLMKPGNLSPIDLAKRFGFTERYVRQRLRLAELIPEILDAVRERKITLDAAMAYARSADQDLQRQVFEKQERANWEKHEPRRITTDYGAAYQNTSCAIYKFVGAEAYEAAGGGYDDDLISGLENGEKRTLTHGVLLGRLAEEKAEAMAAEALPKLQRKTTSLVSSILIPPGGRVGGRPSNWPKAPKGYERVDLGYGDPAEIWMKFVKPSGGAPLIAIAGVNQDGEFEIFERSLFVTKEAMKRLQAQALVGRSATSPSISQEEREAQRIAAQRQAGVHLLAWRNGVGKFAGTPLEGRAHWPNDAWTAPTEDAPAEHFGEPGMFVAVQIFVPTAAFEANLAAAEAGYDELITKQAGAREDERRQRLEAEQELDARLDEILKMDPEPRAIAIDAEPFFRTAEGWWVDDRDLVDADPDDARFEAAVVRNDLGELLDEVSIGEALIAYATLEAFDAAHAGAVA